MQCTVDKELSSSQIADLFLKECDVILLHFQTPSALFKNVIMAYFCTLSRSRDQQMSVLRILYTMHSFNNVYVTCHDMGQWARENEKLVATVPLIVVIRIS
jgi:hypothetical protein